MKQDKAKTADELQARLEEALADRLAAQADVDLLTSTRAELIRREATDSELDAHEKKLVSASRRAERAAVRIELLSADVAAATEAEAAERQAQLEAVADEAAGKAAQLLTNTLEHFTPIMQKALRAMFEADKLVRTANQTRPAGLEPLPIVEARFRLREPLPRKIISSEQVELWTHPGENRPLGEDRLPELRVGQDGRGFLFSEHSGPHYLERKVFLKRTFLPALRFETPARLVAELCLPPVKAGQAFGWRPVDEYVYSEDGLLARLDKLQAQQGDVEDPRHPEVEFVAAANTAAAA
jgi:hypothetical protein